MKKYKPTEAVRVNLNSDINKWHILTGIVYINVLRMKGACVIFSGLSLGAVSQLWSMLDFPCTMAKIACCL